MFFALLAAVRCLAVARARQVLSWRRATRGTPPAAEVAAGRHRLSCFVGLAGRSASSLQRAARQRGQRYAWPSAIRLPVSIGVGVLQYRLYDIDRIISRTLAYAIVTGLLVGVYAGSCCWPPRCCRFHTPVAVAASTLAAAALFNPLRRRVQRAVDRRFNRARYDADQTVAVFAARLKDAVDLDAVRDDLASVVHQALEPAHVSLWISQRD